MFTQACTIFLIKTPTYHFALQLHKSARIFPGGVFEALLELVPLLLPAGQLLLDHAEVPGLELLHLPAEGVHLGGVVLQTEDVPAVVGARLHQVGLLFNKLLPARSILNAMLLVNAFSVFFYMYNITLNAVLGMYYGKTIPFFIKVLVITSF